MDLVMKIIYKHNLDESREMQERSIDRTLISKIPSFPL